ncbi:hypothetical protein ACHHYP_16189 [Achlya hypogyna]|uniref:EF-hand domain-containing protein n=1 Tax=Achlya hypogyna TaxID=1202772 RepID=A0A1V9Y9H7_ACHHY|nr:hypothetical protein ACHHYP_16189 [Achlya hypogyna]
MSLRCPSPRQASHRCVADHEDAPRVRRPKSSTSASLRIRDPDATMHQTSAPHRSYNQYPFTNVVMTTPRRRHIKAPPPKGFYRAADERNNWVAATRPVSPVALTPAVVMQHIAHEAHPAINESDLSQVQRWLESLETEAQSFTSYFLFCEMKFHETTVLATGKETPNHLRTAVAFYCLQQASGIFGRYHNVLTTICQNLGSAIYKDFDQLSGHGQRVTAAHCYSQGTTYFDHSKTQDSEATQLRDQIATLEHEKRRLERKLKLAQTQTNTNQNSSSAPESDRRKSMTIHDVETLGTSEKVRLILAAYKTLDPSNKRLILVELLQAAEQPLDAEAMADAVQCMHRDEAEKLTYQLAAEFGHSVYGSFSSATSLKPRSSSVVGVDAQKAKIMRTFESKEVLEAERASYEQLILLRNELAHAKETYLEDIRHERDRNEILSDELKELLSRHRELSHQVPRSCSTTEQATQTDEPATSAVTATVVSQAPVRPFDMATSSGKVQMPLCRFHGISELIADAKLLPKHIKKIFAKRKPMVVQELCATIAAIYQAKMLQDISNDVMGQGRQSLIEFMRDLFVLYHGLRGLAIGQFICIDNGVRKFCEKNARVRVFGMLLGSSAQPCATYKSIGASHQAIDFYLYVLALVLQIGHYTLQTDAATAAAATLSERLGDGIVGSPRATRIPLPQALDVVATAFSFEGGPEGNSCYAKLEQLTDEAIEVDALLENVMSHWFKLFNQQVDFMHTLFESMDREQNGIIEFADFHTLATQLDAQMTQRDCLAMYAQIASTDNVIDGGAFVMAMIEHQQQVLARKRAAPLARAKSGSMGHRHSDVGIDGKIVARQSSFRRPSAPKARSPKRATVELSSNLIGRLRALSLKAVDAPIKNVEARKVRGSLSSENWNVSIGDIIARRPPTAAIDEGDSVDD